MAVSSTVVKRSSSFDLFEVCSSNSWNVLLFLYHKIKCGGTHCLCLIPYCVYLYDISLY